jgi:hypothetical protein
MREKWDKRHHADGRTYGQATIERALSTVAKTYRPGDHREKPSPWGTDPPVEAYADDPECQGRIAIPVLVVAKAAKKRMGAHLPVRRQ